MVGVKNPNKKAQKAKNAISRVRVDFNTGTRTHKSKKDYDICRPEGGGGAGIGVQWFVANVRYPSSQPL